MRAPSSVIVVDAAILIAVLLGRHSEAYLAAGLYASLTTTDRVLEETRRRIALGLQRPELIEKLAALTSTLTIVHVARLEPRLPAAESTLRDAAASRNGSTRDAHVLALAQAADADIWTTDRDFAGTGVATWSTPNLMRALAPI